ncbi:MAG: tRNA 4-thiouridine(8) synthase ThiI [Treponema sp.]|jgi:thiamine biosynthesis protein ThiI|nr:tRNA 4-thiouridine(8) synthase ThiI [Treponema sp.]
MIVNEATYLLKPGELTLKGGNREGFERILRRNLILLLSAALGRKNFRLENTNGRYYVFCGEEEAGITEKILDRFFGISGWAKARKTGKTPEEVMAACAAEGRELSLRGIRSFKIEARRTDKSFPLSSYEICCRAGDRVREAAPCLEVRVKNPEAVIGVEIREKAFIYGDARRGLGGLPVGTAGRGLLLLSGGIDSPVAGWMMAGRGMGIDAVYFHAYPYTSEEARQKVIKLAEIVGSYTLGIRLHCIGFTKVQVRIKERAPPAWNTVMLRMAMMECAERIARRNRCRCLITGESLSQVASQTIENLACTQSRLKLPVLRPLIGMDKDRIIRVAESINTYETSILPYADCCSIFSPAHPILRGNTDEAKCLYESLQLEDLLDEALKEDKIEKCGALSVSEN